MAMRIFRFLWVAIATFIIIYSLNRPWGASIPMPIGQFLSPSHGLWRNAEPSEEDFGGELTFPALKGKASVYLDERLVPHVFTENDHDLYFIQGYLHARFRLFQMDLQTRAAAGRASEVAGERAIEFDRLQRRLGMGYAAEEALKEIESDPQSKAVFDAYTAGVNTWISSLDKKDLPVEYKILHIQPEPWSNLRTALLLKMMAKMLASGTETDLANTNAKAIFSEEQLRVLYPELPDSLKPVIPSGTKFTSPVRIPVPPKDADAKYFQSAKQMQSVENFRPNPANGSNSWVLSGSKTRSGFPILCNDPHLELSLPSIWYEMQLSGPSSNTYGVSLPGSPFIIIGFNDYIAWGVTNAMRDVKDYYEIKFRDNSKKAYWYNGRWTNTHLRIEEIKVKGSSAVYDTVAYTAFGPVMFDHTFSSRESPGENLAVRWTAHDKGNEAQTFLKLSNAKTYDDYERAISTFNTPGQNFVFASKSGDIAMWQQGKFPLRWKGQGRYVMPGTDSSYLWQGFIPQKENPHAKNPKSGFLQSANQRPADKNYPYYIPGAYMNPRSLSIDEKLAAMTNATIQDMMKLHSDCDNIQARYILPLLQRLVIREKLPPSAQKHLKIISAWDFQASALSQGQTIYQCWMDSLQKEVWQDEISQAKPAAPYPDTQTLIELMLRDSVSSFYDRIDTPKKETLRDVITTAFLKASAQLSAEEPQTKLEWSQHKKVTIFHLLKEALPSFARPGLPVGGAGNVINAVTKTHGPSWRMIVEMGNKIQAYGVYPAGQNGNPGSRFYDDYVDTWVKGEYFPLWMMARNEYNDPKVKWTIHFSNQSK